MPTKALPTILTNEEVQAIVSDNIRAIHALQKTTPEVVEAHSLALARLTRAHVLCTRTAVYGVRTAISATNLGVNISPNLNITLQLPVFKKG